MALFVILNILILLTHSIFKSLLSKTRVKISSIFVLKAGCFYNLI